MLQVSLKAIGYSGKQCDSRSLSNMHVGLGRQMRWVSKKEKSIETYLPSSPNTAPKAANNSRKIELVDIELWEASKFCMFEQTSGIADKNSQAGGALASLASKVGKKRRTDAKAAAIHQKIFTLVRATKFRSCLGQAGRQNDDFTGTFFATNYVSGPSAGFTIALATENPSLRYDNGLPIPRKT